MGCRKDSDSLAGSVQTLRDAVANIAPLLTVEVDQVPADDSALMRIAISCNYDPDGIEAVQALVAATPAIRHASRSAPSRRRRPWKWHAS
jgi:hypothetical protein